MLGSFRVLGIIGAVLVAALTTPALAKPGSDLPRSVHTGDAPGCGESYRMRRSAPYAWLDASDGLAVVEDDDENSDFMEIPFEFVYFGRLYKYIAVSSNGWVSFEDPDSDDGSREPPRGFPDSALPDGPIALAWADLDPSDDSQPVRTKTFGASPSRSYVVQWTDVPRYSSRSTTAYTFQLVLFEGTNEIKFQYQSMTGGTDGFSIGIESPDHLIGYQAYLFEDVSLGGRAVSFKPNVPALACTATIPLACGGGRSADTLRATPSDPANAEYPCGDGLLFLANERSYKFTLTEVQLVDIELTGSPDQRMFLFDACTTCQCVLGNTQHITTMLGPGSYFIVVDSVDTASAGPFDLSLDCEPALTAPTGTVMDVGATGACDMVIDFDRWSTGHGIWATTDWTLFERDGENTFHSVRLDGGLKVYLTKDSSSCESDGGGRFRRMDSWVDDNTDKGVVYWEAPEVHIVQEVSGIANDELGTPCCGVRVDTTITNRDVLPHFFEFRALYDHDYGQIDGISGLCSTPHFGDSGPIRVDGTVYAFEQDLGCTPPGVCGLACSTPLEIFSADDLDPWGGEPRVIHQIPIGGITPTGAEAIERNDGRSPCGSGWDGFADSDPISSCDNSLDNDHDNGFLYLWRVPEVGVLAPGESASFIELIGRGCRLDPSCGPCLANADIVAGKTQLCGSVTPDTTQLDGSGSSLTECLTSTGGAGSIAYSWRKDGLPLGTAGPLLDIAAGSADSGSFVYTLEVRCDSTEPGYSDCTSSRSVVVDVEPDGTPVTIGDLRMVKSDRGASMVWDTGDPLAQTYHVDRSSLKNGFAMFDFERIFGFVVDQPLLDDCALRQDIPGLGECSVPPPPSTSDAAFYKVKGVSCSGLEGF